MKLIPNWRAELREAWSHKLTLMALAIYNAPDLLNALSPALNVESIWFKVAATLTGIGSFAAKFIDQDIK